MKVELGKISSITHGVVLNRVKPKGTEKEEQFPVLTIKQLLLEEEGESMEEPVYMTAAASKRDNLRFAKEGTIVIGLTSFHQAAVLTKEHEGMVIPSNFLILEFPGGIMDPYYFAWYFNEHPEMKELRRIAIQGDSKVKVLSIQVVRKLTIECPNLVTQMSIGNLYCLQKEKERLWKEKLKLEMMVLTDRMKKLTKEEGSR